MIGDKASRAAKGELDLTAKERDLTLQIGRTILSQYVKALELTRDTLSLIVGFAQGHQTAFKGIVELFVGLSAAALAESRRRHGKSQKSAKLCRNRMQHAPPPSQFNSLLIS